MRNDWYSVKTVLTQHNWNLIRALTAWFRAGIPPKAHPKDKKGMGRRIDHSLRRLPMPSEEATKPMARKDAEKVWAKERREFMKEDYAGGHKKIPLREVRKRKFGFLINEDRRPIQPVEARDLSKFLVEYIKDGKYYNNRMKGEYFTWPELEGSDEAKGSDASSDSDSSPSDTEEPPKKKVKLTRTKRKDGLDYSSPVPFDFGNKTHIAQLNQWRPENMSRVTGILLRPGAQKWTEEELDYLYDLHMELLQNKMEETGKGEDELLPMTVPNSRLKEWAKRLSQKFNGRVMREGEEPRHDRQPAAINTQRVRTPNIVAR
jgi:hypothetical protein